MPVYVDDPLNPGKPDPKNPGKLIGGKRIDVIELQKRNPLEPLEPYFIKEILKRDVWERREALLILAGFDPCGTVWPDKAMTPNRITYLDGTTAHQLIGAGITHPLESKNLAAYYTLSRYAKGLPYDENKTPEQWLAWAKEKSFTPYWLDYAKANQSAPTLKVNAVDDDVKRAGNKAANTPDNQTPTKNWILKVQAEATRKWEELVEMGCSPTRNNIKDDLATWCRDENNNIKTDYGIFPTAEYIYRHVIRKAIWKPPTK